MAGAGKTYALLTEEPKRVHIRDVAGSAHGDRPGIGWLRHRLGAKRTLARWNLSRSGPVHRDTALSGRQQPAGGTATGGWPGAAWLVGRLPGDRPVMGG